jgi:hypothetical protein
MTLIIFILYSRKRKKELNAQSSSADSTKVEKNMYTKNRLSEIVQKKREQSVIRKKKRDNYIEGETEMGEWAEEEEEKEDSSIKTEHINKVEEIIPIYENPEDYKKIIKKKKIDSKLEINNNKKEEIEEISDEEIEKTNKKEEIKEISDEKDEDNNINNKVRKDENNAYFFSVNNFF